MNDDTMHNAPPLFEEAGALQTEALSYVRNGMRIVDLTGEEVGIVEFVKMGDATAATTRGSTTPGNTSLVGIALDTVFGNEPDLPQAERDQLLRYGYIKVDGSDLGESDGYVRADKVRHVSGETVQLNISKQQLLNEG